ncbi:MAG: helix-turn-helix transcriptional regulator [Gammaproteobacteria bacterium]|nr:MAG: helix-turn-helix transcriptional regulator [Gammaproteobacteria bacterium]
MEPPLSSDVLRTRKAAKGNTLPRRSTRNAILEAAMKQFIERGFSACSVEDITKAARVPKGSSYNHFKSKQLLAAEIVTEYGKGTTDRSVLTNPAMQRRLPGWQIHGRGVRRYPPNSRESPSGAEPLGPAAFFRPRRGPAPRLHT